MENLILLFFVLCIIAIYMFHKKDLDPFQSTAINEPFQSTAINEPFIATSEPELSSFIRNKAGFQEKIRDLERAMLQPPKSIKMNDSIVQDYKLQLGEITKLESEQITNTNVYNKNIIDNLNNKLDTLEKITGATNMIEQKIKGVQSFQDGLKVNLNPIALNRYQIMLNDGCLDVRSSNKYGINVCNPSKKTQHFDIQYVNNDAFYNTTIEHGLDKVESDDKIQYPFYVLKSSNTDNCLQNNFGYLSIEPCVVRKGQRWTDLSTQNKCIV